jgi:hypothetical protein
MLSRPAFALLVAAIALGSAVLAITGRAFVRAMASPGTSSRVLEYAVVAVILALGGALISWLSYRRVAGDSRLPPPTKKPTEMP